MSTSAPPEDDAALAGEAVLLDWLTLHHIERQQLRTQRQPREDLHGIGQQQAGRVVPLPPD